MALEYDLQSDTDVSPEDLRTFLAEAVEGEIGPGGTVFRQGMYVMSGRVEPGEEDLITDLFGFEHRVTATYRFSNLAEPAERDHNTMVMARSVLTLFERYGGHGVLLFNGDVAVIEWDPAGVVFDSGWETWHEVDAVRPLVNGHALRRLRQPLLPAAQEPGDDGR